MGQVVLAGFASTLHGQAQLIQGPAAGPFAAAAGAPAGAGAPLALDSAYLGDVALAAGSPAAPGAIGVSIERHLAHRFNPRIAIRAGGGGPVRALSVALDYRSDAVAVWEQGGYVYARDQPASGTARAAQRLGRSGPEVHVAALRSDDERAIVAWSDERAGVTSVYLDLSAAGARFGAPVLLERFTDPQGLAPPAASPRLVRLRSESVMLAWAGAAGGRWVVRTAAVDLLGVRAVTTIAAGPGGSGDALLAGLAPAPDGSALALWSEPARAASGSPGPRPPDAGGGERHRRVPGPDALLGVRARRARERAGARGGGRSTPPAGARWRSGPASAEASTTRCGRRRERPERRRTRAGRTARMGLDRKRWGANGQGLRAADPPGRGPPLVVPGPAQGDRGRDGRPRAAAGRAHPRRRLRQRAQHDRARPPRHGHRRRALAARAWRWRARATPAR